MSFYSISIFKVEMETKALIFRYTFLIVAINAGFAFVETMKFFKNEAILCN